MTEIAPVLFAIDLDRTLLDTDRAFGVLVDVCDATGTVDRETLLGARAEIEASGGSFDVLKYLEARGIKGEAMHALYGSYIAEGQKTDMLYPDAQPFLEVLDKADYASLILTYGGKPWQMAKLAASSLIKRNHLITDESNKGALIAGWQLDGPYSVVGSSGKLVMARSITLIDDKASSFTGMPDNCRGFLIDRPRPDGKSLPSQAGEVPANVERQNDLTVLTAWLRLKLEGSGEFYTDTQLND